MTGAHLTPEQAQALYAEIRDARPTCKEYLVIHRELVSLQPVKRKAAQRGRIQNTRPGVHGIEKWSKPLIKLMPGFRVEDLPPGWGLYSIHDSGGNHALDNGGTVLWTWIWNYWNGHRVAPWRQTWTPDQLAVTFP